MNQNPMFSDIIHVGYPNLGNYQIFQKLVDDIFARRWFSNGGSLVTELESRLSEYLEVKHCIAVSNGTMGLQIACQALGLTGEVIVPSFTFIATVHCLQWLGIKPIFVDIDPNTHNLDYHKIEKLISKDTSAILGVHLWGRPCNPEIIETIAKKYGIMAIFDAAHAFHSRHQGRAIGNFGNCEVFSFHATKIFHTFEGGAITTNDDRLAHKIRLMKKFGFAGMDHVVSLGINGKMSEIHAAMGLACFDVLEDILEKTRRNYNTYLKCLQRVPGIKFLDYEDLEQANFQYIVIEIDPSQAILNRDQLMDLLHRNNVKARRYFYPGCHLMEPYSTLYPEQLNNLPNTDFVASRILVLPNYSDLTTEKVEMICALIRESVLRKAV